MARSAYYSDREGRRRSRVEYLDPTAYEPQGVREVERTEIEYSIEDEGPIALRGAEVARAIQLETRRFLGLAKETIPDEVLLAFTGGDPQYDEAAREIIAICNSPVDKRDSNHQVITGLGLDVSALTADQPPPEEGGIYRVHSIDLWREEFVDPTALARRLAKAARAHRYQGIEDICLDDHGRLRSPDRKRETEPRRKARGIAARKAAAARKASRK
jgi:hypothetical protein